MINVSRKDKKIGLSIKRLEESEERDIYQSYLNNKTGATSNLGELIKEGMSNVDQEPLSSDISIEVDTAEEDNAEEDNAEKHNNDESATTGSPSETEDKKIETA